MNLLQISRLIHLLTSRIGMVSAWFVLVITLVSFVIVVMRYGFRVGSIPLQESVQYLHAAIFMLAMGYSLQCNEHVRLDVIYAKLHARTRAKINIAGFFLALLPMCTMIFFLSWEYVTNSWSYLETSPEPGGLPFIYVLKTLILAMPILLVLQGIAQLIDDLHTIHND